MPRNPSAVTTSLGTTQPTTRSDGKFRTVKITLNNNVEAKLDFRKGYFANKVLQQVHDGG